MSGRVLLDTNVVIAIFGGDESVLSRLDEVESPLVPAIVVGELHYGARKSKRVQGNIARIGEFVDSVEVLSVDHTTAAHYGVIKEQLRAGGRPIPENDIWIAALSLQHRLPLASRDQHFQRVYGLTVERW